MKPMQLLVSTPAQLLHLEAVVALRFLTEDGWRGVLPGHEPTRARLSSGPIRCRLQPEGGRGDEGRDPQVRWLATEGGVLFVDRHELRILTRWVGEAPTLAELRDRVEERDRARVALEQEARALAARHEIATQRALVALERKIGRT